jgi:PTH1 family peptidyl-tRNA hydrolase
VIVICGLGNPGSRYRLTRHNLGFLFLDCIASLIPDPVFYQKFFGRLCVTTLQDQKVLLFKPELFMNCSGRPLSLLLGFYKLSASNLIVVHDDVDLEFLNIKIKKGGSCAGHNGLRSIDCAIGENYWRLRFGVGRSQARDLSSHVLSEFASQDMCALNESLIFIAKNMGFLCSDIGANKSIFIDMYKKHMGL